MKMIQVELVCAVFLTLVSSFTTEGRCPQLSTTAQAVDSGRRPSAYETWSRCSKSCGEGRMSKSRSLSIQCNTFHCHCHMCCEIDLVFVVDHSASMWSEWEMVKQFMREVVHCMSFDAPFGVRVGIVMYESTAIVHRYLWQGKTLASVINAINTMPDPTGGTNMESGLDLLDRVFHSSKGDRCKVCNVAIVLSDYAQWQGDVQTQIDLLKIPPRYNIKFFAIAFGQTIGDSPLLDEVANDANRYYSRKVTPNNMSLQARQVAGNACKACQQCNNFYP